MLTRRILVILLAAVALQLQAQERKMPLTGRQVEMLARDLGDARLAEEVRTRGVDPPLSSAEFQHLRSTGVGPITQAALRSFLLRSTLTITVDPAVSDVSVAVADRAVATDAHGQATIAGLVPGTYVLSAAKPPLHPRTEQRIYLTEGGSTVRVPLRIATGRITVITDSRDARIEIANQGPFPAPLRDLELPAGRFSLVVTTPNYLPYMADVEVLPNQTKVIQPALVIDRTAMERFVQANSDSLISELRSALNRGDADSFRARSAILLEYGGDKLFDVKVLHHHASGFHEARLTIRRSGLLFEPLGRCPNTTEVLPWNRISRTAITHQGASGVLLFIEVVAGRNFDRKVPLNFAVLGSSIGQESETKPLSVGRVTFGQSITTSSRVQSPANAARFLTDLAWLIDQAQSESRSHEPETAAVGARPAQEAKTAVPVPLTQWNPAHGPWTRFSISNETFKVVEIFLDDAVEPITIRAQRVYSNKLQEGSTHTMKAIVGGSTFTTQFRVPRVMNSVWITEQGIQIR